MTQCWRPNAHNQGGHPCNDHHQQLDDDVSRVLETPCKETICGGHDLRLPALNLPGPHLESGHSRPQIVAGQGHRPCQLLHHACWNGL